jgi:hypothetical protein
MAVQALMRGMSLALDAGEAWQVANGAVKAWNIMLPVLRQQRHGELRLLLEGIAEVRALPLNATLTLPTGLAPRGVREKLRRHQYQSACPRLSRKTTNNNIDRHVVQSGNQAALTINEYVLVHVQRLLQLPAESTSGSLLASLVTAYAQSVEHCYLLALMQPEPTAPEGQDTPAAATDPSAPEGGVASGGWRFGETEGYEVLPKARAKAGTCRTGDVHALSASMS